MSVLLFTYLYFLLMERRSVFSNSFYYTTKAILEDFPVHVEVTCVSLMPHSPRTWNMSGVSGAGDRDSGVQRVRRGCRGGHRTCLTGTRKRQRAAGIYRRP